MAMLEPPSSIQRDGFKGRGQRWPIRRSSSLSSIFFESILSHQLMSALELDGITTERLPIAWRLGGAGLDCVQLVKWKYGKIVGLTLIIRSRERMDFLDAGFQELINEILCI